MSIKFFCTCGKRYKVSDHHAGKKIRCKICGEKVPVPQESQKSIPSGRAAQVSQRSILPEDDEGPDEDAEAGEDEGAEEGAADEAPPLKAKAAPVKAAKKGDETQRVQVPELDGKVFKKRDEEAGPARGVGSQGRLVLLDARGRQAESFPLGKGEEHTVGRSSKCSIKLDAPAVSKEHLKVEHKMGAFIATDLKSTNGLVVNGKQLRRASLKDGDLLQLGDVVLKFELAK